MKLSMSTLGCPDWTFEQVLDNFSKLHCDIEIRGIDGEMDADRIVRFFPENAEETKRLMREKGLKFVSFGSSCKFHDPATQEKNIADAKTAVDVCARMDIPSLRVFGNDIPDKTKTEETVVFACKGFKEVCAYAEKKGVRVNLEIHGDFNSMEALNILIREMKDVPAFGIIWDVEHSDKTVGDNFLPFYALIKPFIHHIHIKDYLRDEHYTLKLLGEGDIPLPAIVRQLQVDGYDGYYSFEWEKAWHKELPEPEIAFPHFVNYMKQFA